VPPCRESRRCIERCAPRHAARYFPRRAAFAAVTSMNESSREARSQHRPPQQYRQGVGQAAVDGGFQVQRPSRRAGSRQCIRRWATRSASSSTAFRPRSIPRQSRIRFPVREAFSRGLPPLPLDKATGREYRCSRLLQRPYQPAHATFEGNRPSAAMCGHDAAATQ